MYTPKRSPVRSTSLCVLAISVLSGIPVYAGPVTGRVIDQSGRAVPGAQVLLVVHQSAPLVAALTGSSGEFELAAPDAGRYEIRIAIDGFRAAIVSADGSVEPRDLGRVTLAISAVSESVLVSAAQVEIPLTHAPSSVTVITGVELESRHIYSVADALRTVPGLAVVGTGSLGAVTGVFPRGGESNYTLVFVDDVPANGFGGEFDFGHLSMVNVERIEIVRGPQSALFGSNAIGAVVRVITKRGGPPSGAAAIEAGSFGTSRAAAAGAGSFGAWQWGAAAERLASDGQNGRTTDAGLTVRNDDYARNTMSAALGWRTPSGAAVRGDARFARDERGVAGPFGTNPIGAYEGIDEVSRGANDTWLASLAGVVPMGARARTHALATYGRVESDFVSPFGPSESSSRRLSVRAQFDVTVSRHLDLSAGVEVQRERAGSTFITGEQALPVPITRDLTGYFVEARMNAGPRLFALAGVRIDDIHRDALEGDPNGFPPRLAFADDSVVSANPRLSAAWFARPGAGNFTKLRGGIGTGIRPPGAFDIAFTDNPSLQPERSVSAELGIDQAFAGGHGLFEATAFVNEYDDLIVAVGSFRESSRYRTDNISNARARGFEAAAGGRVRIGARTPIELHARAAYTFLDTEILAVDGAGAAEPPFAVGDPLLRRPRHQLAIDVAMTAGRLGAYVRGGARARVLDVEPSFGTFGGLFYSDSFTAWAAGGSWRLLRGLEITARLDNIFDRSYEEALGFPVPGRGAHVGLRVAAGR